MNVTTHNPRKTVVLISLAASVLMLVGKLTAWYLTSSVALLSDAAESLVHGVATGLAAFSVWYAERPADAAHPYGHGRIAYFSAGFEGALVFATSIAVVWNGINSFADSAPLQHLGVGLWIAGGLAAFNLVLGLALIRIGRRHNTLILVANGQHVLSDMWTSVAAIAGVGLVMFTGVRWLDPLAAIVIGVLIMVNGLRLVQQSYAGLMDQVTPELTERISGVLQEHVTDGRISGYHQLRCRQVDNVLWIDAHLLVPAETRVDDAHERATALETDLEQRLAGFDVRVTSHVEPADHAAAHPDGHAGVADPLGAGE